MLLKLFFPFALNLCGLSLFGLGLSGLSACVSAYEFNRVALISVSSQYQEAQIPLIVSQLQRLGYRVTKRHLSQSVSDFGYVNTDERRAQNLITTLMDDDIDVIWFVRGGAGAVNLLPYLQQAKAQLKRAKPKLLVGYSDISAIHFFVNEELNWPSIHGVVASANENVADKKWVSVNDREPMPNLEAIFAHGVFYDGLLALNKIAENGSHGLLTGGNLTVTSSLFATTYQPDLKDKVLFLEDVGTSYRQLDRSLHQLLFMKDLKVSAIIFGQFYPLQASYEDKLIFKLVLRQFAHNFNRPVYYYPHIGHGRENHPLILGSEVTLTCKHAPVRCFLHQVAP